MKRPQKISIYDFSETQSNNMLLSEWQIPTSSAQNIDIIVQKHNDLVNIVETIADHCGFQFEEEEKDVWGG